MNRLKLNAVTCLLMMVCFLTACSDDDNAVLIESFKVAVTYPETYVSIEASGAMVKITNTSTSEVKTATTDSEGTAYFEDLLPGTYMINASRTLTPAEALTLTGYESEIFLNGAITSFEITTLTTSTPEVKLEGSAVGGLVFKQIYYAMSKTVSGSSYLQDQFYELYNNSTDTIYADGLCIGDVHGNPGSSTSAAPTGFKDDTENVYLRAVWRVPGSGTDHPIAPGKSFLIAQTAINHYTDEGNTNSVDLGKNVSDYEVYVSSSTKDVDNPDVPNMEQIYAASPGYYWNTYVFGASMVVFRHNDLASLEKLVEPGTTSTTTYVQVPVGYVLDAVELLANSTAASFKKIPTSLDAGFLYCSGTYTSESVIRKVRSTTANGRKILQDSNNTNEDFVVIKPPLPKGWN